jgi:RNA polymerase sigma-70 factor (ECF subfamily)
MRNAHETAGSDDAKTPQTGEADSLQAVWAAQRGEGEALERLLAAARPKLFALALRVLGDVDEAEDAVQDALIKVWKNLGRFEGRSAFTTWLHRIAVNAALDRVRRRPVVATGAEPDERRDTAEHASADTPERLYARAEAGYVVRRAVARLPSVHGEALRLCDLEGDSYAEIATATRCPIGTVMSRLYHARRKLVRELVAGARGDGDLDALRAA